MVWCCGASPRQAKYPPLCPQHGTFVGLVIDLQDSGGAQPLRSASTFNIAARTKTTVNNVAHIVVTPPLPDKLNLLHQMQQKYETHLVTRSGMGFGCPPA